MAVENGDFHGEAVEQPTPHLLRDVMVDLNFAPNRGLDPSVRAIDLGVFRPEADAVLADTLADPDKREHGTQIYTTGDRRVLLDNKRTILSPIGGGVVITHNIINPDRSLPAYMRYDKVLTTIVHGHGISDLPVSPIDLIGVLMSDTDTEEVSTMTMAFAVSQTRYMMAFRTEQTPTFSQHEAIHKARLWIHLAAQRATQFTTSEMTEKQKEDIENRAQLQLLKQVGEKYGIRYFFGTRDSSIVQEGLI